MLHAATSFVGAMDSHGRSGLASLEPHAAEAARTAAQLRDCLRGLGLLAAGRLPPEDLRVQADALDELSKHLFVSVALQGHDGSTGASDVDVMLGLAFLSTLFSMAQATRPLLAAVLRCCRAGDPAAGDVAEDVDASVAADRDGEERVVAVCNDIMARAAALRAPPADGGDAAVGDDTDSDSDIAGGNDDDDESDDGAAKIDPGPAASSPAAVPRQVSFRVGAADGLAHVPGEGLEPPRHASGQPHLGELSGQGASADAGSTADVEMGVRIMQSVPAAFQAH